MSRRLRSAFRGTRAVDVPELLGQCEGKPRLLRRRSFWKRVVVIACGLVAVAPARAADLEGSRVFEAVQQQVRTVFEKCRGAVVKIEGTDAHGRLSGTGFFIDPNGTLYTCYSVGGETRDISVTLNGVKHSAVRVFGDLRSGVAILKIAAETPFLTFGSSRSLAVTSPVMTLGYPMDLPVSPSFGMVAGFDIKYLGRLFATTHIRANVPVQRGQGGAPLLNLNGEVVGLLISSLDEGSASFALPIEAAEKVRNDFVRFREVRRGWLGIQVGRAESPVQGSSVEVKDIMLDSPGLKHGLQTGDVLLQVGERPIKNPEDVLDAAFYLGVDDQVPVRLVRGGNTLELQLHSAKHPDGSPALGRPVPAQLFGSELNAAPLGAK